MKVRTSVKKRSPECIVVRRKELSMLSTRKTLSTSKDKVDFFVKTETRLIK